MTYSVEAQRLTVALIALAALLCVTWAYHSTQAATFRRDLATRLTYGWWALTLATTASVNGLSGTGLWAAPQGTVSLIGRWTLAGLCAAPAANWLASVHARRIKD